MVQGGMIQCPAASIMLRVYSLPVDYVSFNDILRLIFLKDYE